MYPPKPKSKCPDLYVPSFFPFQIKIPVWANESSFQYCGFACYSNYLMLYWEKYPSTREVKRHCWASSLDNWSTVIPVSGTRMPKSALQLSRKPQSTPIHTPLSKREIGPCVINFSNEARPVCIPLQRAFRAYYRHQQMNHIFQTTLFESTIPKKSTWQEWYNWEVPGWKHSPKHHEAKTKQESSMS